eukprot:5197579-Amphidinium_carterae.1
MDAVEVCGLPDGPQGNSFGCFGGLERLPVKERDILMVSNCDTDTAERKRGTIWLSEDAGVTWPVKRLIWEGPFAYSALGVGRTGTESQGWIYCFFEANGTSAFAGIVQRLADSCIVCRVLKRLLNVERRKSAPCNAQSLRRIKGSSVKWVFQSGSWQSVRLHLGDNSIRCSVTDTGGTISASKQQTLKRLVTLLH